MIQVVKIDIDSLSKKDNELFVSLLDNESFKRFILKKTSKSIIITTTLFDYLEYEIYAKKSYLKKLKFSLLQKNKNNKYEFKVKDCKAGTDDYNLMLRLIRMERVT